MSSQPAREESGMGDGANWERFMLLWSLTPEIYVGSCIISVVAVIAVYFITRNDHSRTDDEQMGAPREAKSRQHLNCRAMNPVANEAKQDPSISNLGSSGGIEFPFKELTAYKRSLYRVAAEKLEKSLTEEQLFEEREAQRQQLKAIYDIMKSKEDVFGISNLNQMEEQLKFYG